ncbi:TIM barrel protein [Spiractinospora alimapuensis]|uniref:hydroxypyruvate isomerase family protein n=1 Tax=Spiractinospora alimapuensis TaxID=2820884 RepID=UPI001F17EBFE|nr:TIM barrel protein [Spiractinospora alimapuensis]QVQ51812.1 TIM barrel protein [Spiractinospora alimapuensis]
MPANGAVPHTLRYSLNCSLIFTELPVNERPAAARAAGFEAVEFWWPFDSPVPRGAEVDAFVTAISDAGVYLSGLNFFSGQMPGPDRGVLSHPAREREFRDNVAVVVDIARRTGTKAFNALYGLRQTDVDSEEQDRVALRNILAAAEGVGAIDGTVLIEAVSGAADYPLKTAKDALAVVASAHAAGAPNVAFLADFFHLAMNGDDLNAVVRQHAGEFGHVQIADVPGRGEPGTGKLPLDALLSDTRSGGYDGFVGLEYSPTTPSSPNFDWRH